MKILLLDDEPAVGRVLLMLMERMKQDAVYVPDCLQAWKILQTTKIDLLIADVVIPGMSGIELVERLRQQARFKDLPILMISGKAQQDDIVRVARLGISGFIAKPFKMKDLKKKIQEIYRKHYYQLSEDIARQIWNGRTMLYGEVAGPLIVLGEPVDSPVALCDPFNREIARYLEEAWQAIGATNGTHPGLALGYIVENDTAHIILQLKKNFIKKQVKLILISARCPGKPILLVRMFTLNKRATLPVFLIYDHLDDIPANQRRGLKKLGVNLIKRSELDGGKFQELIEQYVLSQVEQRVPERPQEEEALSAQEIHDRIVEDVEAMTYLPPLPQVCQKILALSKKPQSDLKDWIEIIRVDPMTCATILRHVNTLVYGFKEEIDDIDRAVILLGKETVASLVAGVAMQKAFRTVQEQGFVVEDFWVHSLAVGHAAHILSCPVDEGPAGSSSQESLAALGLPSGALEVLREINLPRRLRLNLFRENPFLGGIMHDIGKMVMVHSYPGLFPLLLRELEKNQWQLPMLAVEHEVTGDLTHPILGEILLRNWGLSRPVVNAALCHHQPEVRDTFSFLIGLADIVGQVLYPFPRHARYPLAKALEAEALDSVRSFLPAEFFDQPLCRSAEVIALTKAISPQVKDYVEKMRLTVKA